MPISPLRRAVTTAAAALSTALPASAAGVLTLIKNGNDVLGTLSGSFDVPEALTDGTVRPGSSAATPTTERFSTVNGVDDEIALQLNQVSGSSSFGSE